MPIHKVKGGWKWGKSGKVYPDKEDAEKQMRAIYASGYKEETFPTFREFLQIKEADRDGEYEQSYKNTEKPNLELLFGKKSTKKPVDKNLQAQINYRKRKLAGQLEPWQRSKYKKELQELEALK